MNKGDEVNLNRKNIWNEKQNKPTLVARDFELLGIDKNQTYEILLKRGVFKWLAVRRRLIKLKNLWKDEIYRLQKEISKGKKNKTDIKELKGRIKMLVICREVVRDLCHSERWQAPDFDKEANEFLNRLDN